jgi:hypothetical protein
VASCSSVVNSDEQRIQGSQSSFLTVAHVRLLLHGLQAELELVVLRPEPRRITLQAREQIRTLTTNAEHMLHGL